MTMRWYKTAGFEVGAGVRWGDARHRSWLWAIHLGPYSLMGVVRNWL